jgi:hypothetical protein
MFSKISHFNNKIICHNKLLNIVEWIFPAHRIYYYVMKQFLVYSFHTIKNNEEMIYLIYSIYLIYLI